MLAVVTPETTFATGGMPWWQAMGSLMIVLGLLLLCLKLLGKWNHRQSGGASARVLAVWPLGPKREIQVLQLGDDVHYIYRHESAMVLLRQESLTSYEANRETADPSAETGAVARLLPKGLHWPGRDHRQLSGLTSS